MTITINGDGTIGGVSVGGLPDGIVDADMLAANAVTTAKINDDAVTAAKRGAGAILQVKNKLFSLDTAFTNTSFADMSGFSEALATSSSSNKVLIILTITLFTYSTSNGASARITYDGNNTAETQRQYTTASGIPGTVSLITLVSPGKTDSITYQVQVKSELASHDCEINSDFDGDNTSHSELILMEVAA
tara:strand:- start:6227 stop:6796 length:570 start_codon:yes stop_codon:yes gene_type:complete